MQIIGRKKEYRELIELSNNNNSELVAVYGRRRVGKTFLINQTFENSFDFKHTAISPSDYVPEERLINQQLLHFFNSLKIYGWRENKIPKDWFQAFYMLERLLMTKDEGRKQIVFIDELPWMDTPKSNFLSAFEAFWNSWANGRNIIVIICGSASSWIVKKIINNEKGLYGRITKEIKLSPFTLKECEEFFLSKDIKLSRYDIVQAYMAVGGIPYYLNYFERDLNVYQNIDKMFFEKNSPLKIEFDRLFAAAFSSPEIVKKIVEVLGKKKMGFTRDEIVKSLNTYDGEKIGNGLNSLIVSDFIIKYRSINDKKKLYYKLVDPFCLFYFKYIKNTSTLDHDLFSSLSLSGKTASYRGIAFENVCFNHIDEIKKALKIDGIISSQSSLLTDPENDENKAQIDLIIERNDNIVNLCEIKFYSDEYINNKDNHLSLVNKCQVLSKYLKKRQSIRPVLITTYSLKYNEYSSDYDFVITLDNLFD